MPSMEEMIYFILFSPSECDSNATQEDVELTRASFNPFFFFTHTGTERTSNTSSKSGARVNWLQQTYWWNDSSMKSISIC